MLSQRIRTLVQGRRPWVRCNSTASTVSYPAQVRVYPFAIDKEEAIRLAAWPMAFIPGNFARNVAARFLPSLGIQAQQPIKIAAVYLPGWIIDADVEAKVWTKRGEEENKPQNVIAKFKNSYLPGFVYDPLSQMTIKDQGKPIDLPTNGVPWSAELKKQRGFDVLCLPFTLTPFWLVDAIHTISFRAATTEDLRFDPTSVKLPFCAAYPVLMPIYLLQYNIESNQRVIDQVSVMVDASQPKGRIAAENLMRRYRGLVPNYTKLPVAPLFDFDLLQWDRDSAAPRIYSQFAALERLLVLPKNTGRDDGLKMWIDLYANDKDAMQKYQKFEQTQRKQATGSSKIDWNDPRIRPYTQEEAHAISVYMRVRSEYALMRDMAKDLTQVGEHVKVASLTIGNTRSKSAAESQKASVQTLDKLVDEVLARLKAAKQRSEEFKPKWLKEWEAQQKPEEVTATVSEKPKEPIQERADLEKKEPEGQPEKKVAARENPDEASGKTSEGTSKEEKLAEAKPEKKPEDKKPESS